jgi:hypothetical protein
MRGEGEEAGSMAEGGTERPTLLGTMRAFAVMSGGPVVLLLFALTGIGVSAWSLLRGSAPPLFALVGVLLLVAYVALFAPWTRRWGTTPAEREQRLPGDESVANPGLRMTRAVTIDAAPQQVWPWLAQIGQDRGGFYSYTWLENLAGCHMHNARTVHAEWQRRAVGETVLLHPAAGLSLTRFEPDRCFALGGWYLVLEPLEGNRTRLLARSRIPKGVATAAYAVFIELPHFIMERRMLRGIKERAERSTLAVPARKPRPSETSPRGPRR